jgi:hypothetical protein
MKIPHIMLNIMHPIPTTQARKVSQGVLKGPIRPPYSENITINLEKSRKEPSYTREYIPVTVVL